MRPKLTRIGLCWGLIVCSSSILVGQVTTGTILGTVRDSSGAVITGAAITIKEVTKGTNQAYSDG